MDMNIDRLTLQIIVLVWGLVKVASVFAKYNRHDNDN